MLKLYKLRLKEEGKGLFINKLKGWSSNIFVEKIREDKKYYKVIKLNKSLVFE